MLKWIFGVLIGLLLILSVMFGRLMVGSELKTEEQITTENPKYHLQLIVQSNDEYFWTFFKEGAIAAEKDFGVYVELVSISQRDIDELRKAVEMGVNAGVDGIALQAADSEQTSKIVEEAKKQGISVVTYENDNYNIPNTPMVGTNSYSLGSIAGDMAVKAMKEHANVAVVINKSGNENDVQFKNTIIQAVKNSFSKYSTINISKIYTIDADLFEAEKVASSIIEDGGINLILCFDERCTPGIAQVLVDNNMVGDIRLIGYGVMPYTLDYIKRGVIYGTVCPNAYEIGYTAVQQMAKSLDGDQISDYVSTKLNTINLENVDMYSQEIEQK
jgi:ribose transport system substrate-binding protein